MSGGDLSEVLGSIASILRDTRAIFAGAPVATAGDSAPLPSNLAPTPIVAAPVPLTSSLNSHNTSQPLVMNTPSKLPRFLHYAETQLGIKQAMSYLAVFEVNGFGPDIFEVVKNEDIEACGMSTGDVIHLKCAAPQWWNGPDAKRLRPDHHVVESMLTNLRDGMPVEDIQQVYPPAGATRDVAGPVAGPSAIVHTVTSIRFIKKFHEGGSESVHSTGMQDGENTSDEYDWYYFNPVTKQETPVPAGKIPCGIPPEAI